VTLDNGVRGRRTDRTASWEHPSSREVARRLAVLLQGPDSPADLTVQELMALGRWPRECYRRYGGVREGYT
jgi:ABC-type cobalamin/Fe3+-siderophores transport system ATPase subunit